VRNFVFSFIRISLYTLLLISVIAIMGVPMSSVVAVFASVGVTIGLALQGSLSNLAGGIMILIFKPFRVGDFIESGNGSGTVTEVSLFYTNLRSLTNERISVPNSALSNTKVTNYSFYDNRRLDLDFSVAYGTDKNTVIKTIMSVVNANPKALNKPEPFLRMTEHAASGITFTLRVWSSKADINDLKSDLLEDVYDAFARTGIEIPYQTIDVNVRRNDE
jgi:small conductance mechanosensitive channel